MVRQARRGADDLEEFPFWFPTGEVFAFAEAESVFLTGPAFERFRDAVEVRDAAQQVLDDFCAIGSLLWPALHAPRIGTILREDADGKRLGNTIIQLEGAELRVKARARLGTGEREGPTAAQALLDAARAGGTHLQMALMLWADPVRTWPRLYRLLEELEKYLGKHVDKFEFCSEPERRRFTQSANCAEVAGKDARHRVGKFKPPANPISLSDAVAFVRKLIEDTLRHEAARP
ncbi:MAG: hypothetical protein ABW061_03630 [Polyangiaceae bacterium]